MNTTMYDVIIIGAGTAGITACKEVSKYTDNFLLVEKGPEGTTCASTGCMPTESLLEITKNCHHYRMYEDMGIYETEGTHINVQAVFSRVRQLRDHFIDSAIAEMDEFRDKMMYGIARFTDADKIEVNGTRLNAKSIIVCTGSHPQIPSMFMPYRDSIITTDELFDLRELPNTIAVIGLGNTGIEMAQAFARLGILTVGIDKQDRLACATDPVINETAIDIIQHEFPLWLNSSISLSQENDLFLIEDDDRQIRVDGLFVSTGRMPTLEALGLKEIGVPFNEKGLPECDPYTLQLTGFPIFIAGDAERQRPFVRDAVSEAKIAAFNAVHQFNKTLVRHTPMEITFTDPAIAKIGLSYRQLDHAKTRIGEVSFADQGRATIMGNNQGKLRIYGDKDSGIILGCEMVAPEGEHLAHLMVVAIEQQMTVNELADIPFYHPVLEEGVHTALVDLREQLRRAA